MKKTLIDFKALYIENNIRNHPNTLRILEYFQNRLPVYFYEDQREIFHNTKPASHPRTRSQYLMLSSHRGELLRQCPGSSGHLCCNYFVINLYIGCPINCSYCILQSYLNQPFTIINVDHETLFDELSRIFEANPDKVYRIGTGELGDSLVYDEITGFSTQFIEFFSHYPNVIFEFKTKTNTIENLMKIKPAGNIVTGFSMNPQSFVDSDEEFAASVEQRLHAAYRLSRQGYKISFHFDPIVHIPDFQTKYTEVIEKIFSQIKPEEIAWISLGTFRYTGNLKSDMEDHYPESRLLYDEFVECRDKKYRYFRPIRTGLYETLIRLIRSKSADLLLYLCMESPDLWLDTMKCLPFKEKKLDLLFRNAVIS